MLGHPCREYILGHHEKNIIGFPYYFLHSKANKTNFCRIRVWLTIREWQT